jgi:putative hydrolase of the HAD superfamily
MGNRDGSEAGVAWSRISTVLFDAVGTLFQSNRSIGGIYSSVASEHGVEVSPEILESRFSQALGEGGTPIDRAQWERLVRDVFDPVAEFDDFDAFFEAVYRFFESGRPWRCYPGTGSVLEVLRQRGYRLGIVSNFDERLDRVLEELSIRNHFSAVVIPPRAGQAKPDPRIFLEAATLLDTLPAETLMVGDDPVLDVEGARSAGMQAVLVDQNARVPDAIPNLADLLGRLRGRGPSRMGG